MTGRSARVLAIRIVDLNHIAVGSNPAWDFRLFHVRLRESSLRNVDGVTKVKQYICHIDQIYEKDLMCYMFICSSNKYFFRHDVMSMPKLHEYD